MNRAMNVRGLVIAAIIMSTPIAFGQSREQKVREDRRKVEAEGYWIYNDLPRAFEKAKESKKPLLVVLRCIPCEECVKLDDELMEQDPIVRALLDKFVCARVVATNGLDLSTFQYDTDQSFAVFLMNADKTIYGRFGTRSHRTEWIGDVSLAGLAAAMRGALELHANYPANRESLVGKRGPDPDVASPELFPSLKSKYTATLNYEGNVVQSCIHCHQIGDAIRDSYRAKGEPLPESILFPYPHPKSIGIVLDPDTRSHVKEVRIDTYAALAGVKVGDEIELMNGQPILSMADVQWVLHRTPPEGGVVDMGIRRDNSRVNVRLNFPAGWRRLDDISWRVSSWGLRRMATGGMSLVAADEELRSMAKIPNGKMALLAKGVGQYGPHAAAKNAGFQKGDVIVNFDGRSDLLREADVFQHAMTHHKPGEQVKVRLWRDGKELELSLPMQP